ncbi:hypothetical protein J6836_00715 [Providencia sp. R33]|uniref:hypothetical protein n=1 Tax=Providencia sp. R33 TaxID=2828763 RepID=UPI001C5A7070|nr:hypothetical protein [Providencia sp. R33]QXX82949.1 hypothetical protein J6836_00715 [Providencia sp. R33]
MTTIAWDGATLAADSQSQVGSMIVNLKEQKIFKAGNEHPLKINGRRIQVIGICGDMSAKDEIWQTLSSGVNFGTAFNELSDFSIIAIDFDGKAFVVSKNKDEKHAYVYETEAPLAIGSGDSFAMGAMKSGKSAEEAVKVAISLDVYSGGDVNSYKILR